METLKEIEQCPYSHNRAHSRGARMALSVCVGDCAYETTTCASLGESVYACAYMYMAALFLNVCVHGDMYKHVTRTVSYITLVKEIGSESV